MKTENPIVEQISSISFEGNVIPPSWYQHIRYTNKRGSYTDHLAVSILADVVYWYRRVEVRDEATGQIVGWRKKFKNDLFQRSYESYANLFGATLPQTKSSFGLLDSLGLLKLVFRHIKKENGTPASNVMHIEPIADAIAGITYRINPEVLQKKTKKKYSRRQKEQPLEDLPMYTNSATPCSRFHAHDVVDFIDTYTETSLETSNGDYLKNIKHYNFPPMSKNLVPLLGEGEYTLRACNSQQATSNGCDAQTSEKRLQGERQVGKDSVESVNPALETAVPNPTGVEAKGFASQQPKQNSQGKTASKQASSTRSEESLTPPPYPPPLSISSNDDGQCAKNSGSPIAPPSLNKDRTLHRLWVDDDGWMQMPTSDRYKLQRYITTRRLQAILQFSVLDEDEIDLSVEDEDEVFACDGLYSLRALRNYAYDKGLITQERFNDTLEDLWSSSVEWCLELKEDAIATFDKFTVIQCCYKHDCETLDYDINPDFLEPEIGVEEYAF